MDPLADDECVSAAFGTDALRKTGDGGRDPALFQEPGCSLGMGQRTKGDPVLRHRRPPLDKTKRSRPQAGSFSAQDAIHPMLADAIRERIFPPEAQ